MTYPAMKGERMPFRSTFCPDRPDHGNHFRVNDVQGPPLLATSQASVEARLLSEIEESPAEATQETFAMCPLWEGLHQAR